MKRSEARIEQGPISPDLIKRLKREAKVIPLDDVILVVPQKKKPKEIKGILKGKTRKSAAQLVREERRKWR